MRRGRAASLSLAIQRVDRAVHRRGGPPRRIAPSCAQRGDPREHALLKGDSRWRPSSTFDESSMTAFDDDIGQSAAGLSVPEARRRRPDLRPRRGRPPERRGRCSMFSNSAAAIDWLVVAMKGGSRSAMSATPRSASSAGGRHVRQRRGGDERLIGGERRRSSAPVKNTDGDAADRLRGYPRRRRSSSLRKGATPTIPTGDANDALGCRR